MSNVYSSGKSNKIIPINSKKTCSNIKRDASCKTQFSFDFLDFEKEKDPTEDGCICSKCNIFFQYAEPNQSDGKTLICWSCKNFT